MTGRARALVQRFGRTRAGVRVIGRVVSPLQRGLLRATGGRLSLTGRAPVLLLTVPGRRTGRLRTVPLFFLRDGERLVVCNVTPQSERPNPWPLNLRAAGRARVAVGRRRFAVTAREATPAELQGYWPRLVRLWPAYQAFADRGGRRTVFVLEPVPRASASGARQEGCSRASRWRRSTSAR